MGKLIWQACRLTLMVLTIRALTSCVHIEGQTPSEMKRDLQGTFLYQSATAFADSSKDPFNAKEALSFKQTKYIISEYQKLVKVLLDTHTLYQKPLQEAFPSMKQARTKPHVIMSDGDLSAPKVYIDGKILIDVRVARLIFREAVLASMKSKELGAPGFMDGWKKYCKDRPISDEDQLNCFLQLKVRIDQMKDQGMIGMMFDKRTWDLDPNAPWFLGFDLTVQSSGLSARYTGVLLFLTAHELGHVLLGHLDAEKDGKFITTSQLMDAERQADDYAVTLLALATPGFSVLSGFEIDRIATGYEEFFGSIYTNARWSNTGDTHPTSTERLARAKILHEAIRDKQATELWEAMAKKIVADPLSTTTKNP